MPADETAALTRLVYGPGTAERARDEAAARLNALAEQRAHAAQSAADARAQELATAMDARRRLRRVRRVAVLGAVSAVVVAAVVFGAVGAGSISGAATSGAAPSGGAASAGATSTVGPTSGQSGGQPGGVSARAAEAGGPPARAAADSSAAGSPGTTSAPNAAGSSTTYSNAAPSDGRPDARARLAPAAIFAVPQTAADSPGVALPGGTVSSSYRLLSIHRFAPGAAFAAMSDSGQMCLVVFVGAADFGETCQSVERTLATGLTTGVTTLTVLNPRTGSDSAVWVRFDATWGADGSFALMATDPEFSRPTGR